MTDTPLLMLPPPPKATRLTKTAWFLLDSTNPSKSVYTMIMEMNRRTNAIRNKELWQMYAAFLFLTGARRNEGLFREVTLIRLDSDGKRLVKVIKCREKSFSRDKKIRATMTSIFLYDADPYEKVLWNSLFRGLMQARLDFRPLCKSQPAKFEKRTKDLLAFNQEVYTGQNQTVERLGANLSKQFARMFHLDLTDGAKIRKDCGVPPHVLRHLRSYDLLAVKGLPDWMVQRLCGWDSKAMVEHYTDLKNTLREREMLQFYKGFGTEH